MTTLPVLTWIGNAAAVLNGAWGAVTRQAHLAGCSRQAAYDQAPKVRQAVADAQAGGPSRAELLRTIAELRQENRQLWESLEQAIDFPQDKQRRFAAAAAAMGLSLRQTWALLAICLPAGCRPSRATLGRWVNQAAGRAARLLAVLDRACQGLVLLLCLDEIFVRRKPVLVGVEPHSLAWVLGRRADDRSGPTWCQALEPWPHVTYVAADGGSGLHLGLELAERKRQEAGPVPPREVNLDNFHIQREGRRALRRDWQEAEAVWVKAEEADRAVARARRQGQDLRRVVHTARAAWEKAAQALAAVERREAAWRRAVAALRLFRPDGRLNDRAWAAAEVAAAVQELPGSRWQRACRMLQNRRALTFLDRLHRELAEAEPRAELRAACAALWRLRHGTVRGCGPKPQGAAAAVAACVQGVVCQKLDPAWQESYRRVARVLGRTVRASSVVECMNSVLRMHQARHRKLTQGLLDLKRLYWNCRRFAAGKRRQRCPYEHLGLKLPTYEPWELLQMDPDELAQKLSTSKVAA
jgi:hypothetical protein